MVLELELRHPLPTYSHRIFQYMHHNMNLGITNSILCHHYKKETDKMGCVTVELYVFLSFLLVIACRL